MIDGEHYPPVVRDALDELPDDVVAAVLVGGTEKLRGGEGLRRAARAVARGGDRASTRPTSCSTSPTSRCSGRASASRSRAARWRSACPYEGADFRFDPPPVRADSRRRRSP